MKAIPQQTHPNESFDLLIKQHEGSRVIHKCSITYKQYEQIMLLLKA